MNKKELQERLAAFPYDRGGWWLVAGGAMVLYGIREQTHDIDLGCSTETADRMQADGLPYRRTADAKRQFRFGEDVEIFEGWLEDRVVEFDGVPVVSIDGLLAMKRALGREKDLRDVERILAFLKREDNG